MGDRLKLFFLKIFNFGQYLLVIMAREAVKELLASQGRSARGDMKARAADLLREKIAKAGLDIPADKIEKAIEDALAREAA